MKTIKPMLLPLCHRKTKKGKDIGHYASLAGVEDDGAVGSTFVGAGELGAVSQCAVEGEEMSSASSLARRALMDGALEEKSLSWREGV